MNVTAFMVLYWSDNYRRRQHSGSRIWTHKSSKIFLHDTDRDNFTLLL